jgi:predicted SnoaL-like aldol condensation-catalyzing enzyme
MTSTAQNKATVLEAFDTLFNKRDYGKAAKFWSPGYIQHSAHIEPGRDGLFNLVKALPHTLRYENHLIFAEGEMVMLHGRFSGNGGPANLIAADILRLEHGILAETLGRPAGRGHQGTIEERAADVRGLLSSLTLAAVMRTGSRHASTERRL